MKEYLRMKSKRIFKNEEKTIRERKVKENLGKKDERKSKKWKKIWKTRNINGSRKKEERKLHMLIFLYVAGRNYRCIFSRTYRRADERYSRIPLLGTTQKDDGCLIGAPLLSHDLLDRRSVMKSTSTMDWKVYMITFCFPLITFWLQHRWMKGDYVEN